MPDTTPFRIIIIGAGPAGLSAALSLINVPSTVGRPVQVTVLERRAEHQTIGGAVNLTPLALRYLDSIGVGTCLRPRGRVVSAIEIVSHRTGGSVGSLWPGVDALRVQRQTLLDSMMETVRSVGSVDGDGDEGGTVSAGQVLRVVFGARIQTIEESGEADGEGSVRIRFTRHSNHTPDQVTGDILLGCDGIHSQVRRTLVDPERSKSYSGKCVANGYAKVSRSQVAGWARGDGHQLLRDTTMVSRGGHSLLISHYQPDDEHVYVAAVLPRPEPAADSDGSTRTGWATATADRASLKADIADTFAGGPLRQSLKELVDMCEEWNFFPVYMLPPGGMWVQGRVLLLGDAAHAMPPQGESTGIAIEDGVLFAHVLSRRDSRTVSELLRDYETLRRPDINKSYQETLTRWTTMPSAATPTWYKALLFDWITWVYVMVMNWQTTDHFARDVRKLALPE